MHVGEGIGRAAWRMTGAWIPGASPRSEPGPLPAAGTGTRSRPWGLLWRSGPSFLSSSFVPHTTCIYLQLLDLRWSVQVVLFASYHSIQSVHVFPPYIHYCEPIHGFDLHVTYHAAVTPAKFAEKLNAQVSSLVPSMEITHSPSISGNLPVPDQRPLIAVLSGA